MNFQNTLIDNSENLKLVDTLKELIKTDGIVSIDFATGYWDIPGTCLLYEELSEFLKKDGVHFRLLIGKDPIVFAKYLKNPKYAEKDSTKEFIETDINSLELKDEYIPAILFLKDSLEMTNSDGSPKMLIHLYSKDKNGEEQFLHSKCYIFRGTEIFDNAYAVIGSSNFTKNGLEGNSELNYLETTTHIVNFQQNPKLKGFASWFEEKWELSDNWTKIFLEEILKKSAIYKKAIEFAASNTDFKKSTLTPYETYIRLLQDKFGMVTDSS